MHDIKFYIGFATAKVLYRTMAVCNIVHDWAMSTANKITNNIHK